MSQREEHLRQQLSSRSCSFCHVSGPPAAFHVVAQRANSWVILATCSSCRHRVLLMVNFSPKKRSSPSPSAASIPYFPFAPVSGRDVTQMRTFLDTFNGDFLSLFGQGPQGQITAD